MSPNEKSTFSAYDIVRKWNIDLLDGAAFQGAAVTGTGVTAKDMDMCLM